MRKYLLLLSVILLAAVFLPGRINLPTVPGAAAAAGELVLSENPDTGHITVETATIKAVWHTRTLAAESYNQGGGALYGLYHKPTDPQLTRNLIAYPSFTGWGNGQSTALWTGIGGVGSTTLYAADTPPATTQSYNFADVLGENNLSGTPEAHAASVDGAGNAVLAFTYRVHNQATGKTWYRVHKRWTVEPAGAIRLEIDWEILSSGYFAEPALRSNWSRDAGWDRFLKYGRDWGSPGQQKYYLGSGSIEDQNCWDTLNRFVPDWIAYTGSAAAPTLVMMSDYGGGFAESGSYRLGTSAWGSPANPVLEQCSLPNRYVGAHVINWMAAWGGNPPKGNRYRPLAAGTAWSDRYRIDLTDDVPAGSLDIASVGVRAQEGNKAQVTWGTNTETDSVVEVSTNPGNAGSWNIAGTAGNMVRDHAVTVNNIVPGTTYTFRVKSRDAAGNLAVSSGYRYLAYEPSFSMSISERSIYWQNYASYLGGLLSVEFAAHNSGPLSADNVRIEAVRNSNGVRIVVPLPVILGQVNADSTATFSIAYFVPAGVQGFRTQLLGSGLGPSGEVINFPQL